MARLQIERVDYDEEYGSGEDLAAMLLAEALAGMGEGEGAAVPFEGSGSAPTPNPSREREGDCVALSAPLPLAGGAGGGRGADDLSSHARPPHRSGPEPLLTRPMQAQFCEHLARHGNVRLACRAARVSAQTAYRMRRASARFRELWDAALVIARDQVEDVLADRAVHGWEEAVFYHGEEVARRRRYDSRLLLAHLARLDKLAERATPGGMVDRFDEVLDALAADEELAVLQQAQDERGLAQDERGPDQALRQAEDEREAVQDEGTPLVEAQLLWLEAHHGPLTEAEEAFHLLHTVPGVPGSAFRAFGWRGDEAELAALNARWQRLGELVGAEDWPEEREDEGEGPDQPCSSSMLTRAEPERTMSIRSAAACDRSSTRPRA